MSKGFSVFAHFGTGKGKTDTDCIFGSIGNCFPADTYDLTAEYSRVSFIPSANFFVGGTLILPRLKVNLNPFIVYSSGRPFNIVTGRDTNGDGVFTERPAFATAQTAPENLRQTRFGDFDLSPAPGQELIPRNFGLGPEFLLSEHRNQSIVCFWQRACAGAQPPPAGASTCSRCETRGAGGPSPEKKYTVTFSVNIQNLLNNTNLSQPIGNLSSTRFGESFSTAEVLVLVQVAVRRPVTAASNSRFVSDSDPQRVQLFSAKFLNTETQCQLCRTFVYEFFSFAACARMRSSCSLSSGVNSAPNSSASKIWTNLDLCVAWRAFAIERHALHPLNCLIHRVHSPDPVARYEFSRFSEWTISDDSISALRT